MRRALLFVFLLSSSCKREPHDDVVLPQVPPDTIVASWDFVSRSPDRQSVHSVLYADRRLTNTTRSPNGTIMSLERTVLTKEYALLVQRLRQLDCCSVASTEAPRVDPAESKPRLELNLGDVRCDIELWDREWLEGTARECGFAFAQVHRSGFVPDPPVDDPAP
jgi:hypothetical protein